MKICSLFKKIFSIFRLKKNRLRKKLAQIETYNDSNLALLLNSFAFIESAKKTPKEEMDQYADSLDEALTKIFEPFCNREENRDAIS